MTIKNTDCVSVDSAELSIAEAIFTGVISFVLQSFDPFTNAIPYKSRLDGKKMPLLLVELDCAFFWLCLCGFCFNFKLGLDFQRLR